MRPSGILAILSAFFFAGCGTTAPAPEIPLPPDSSTVSALPPALPETVAFVMRTDTVDALPKDEPGPADSTFTAGEEGFAVQIGAFKDPQNAIQAQTLARRRYQFSVRNEFYPSLALYQIRIGSFVSRAEARTLLLRMQADHPAEYRDSWIVQIKR